MMKHLIWILAITVLISCNRSKIKKPENLIPENTMVDVLVDLTLLNSALGLKKGILDEAGVVPESFVYKKYSIDSLQFIKSNEYYAHNIDVYQDLYKKVRAKLEIEKAKYKKIDVIETKERKSKDSIRRIERRTQKRLDAELKKREN